MRATPGIDRFHAPARSRCRDGLSFSQVVWVLACTGLLAGLALPALQQAREASRRHRCADQLARLVAAARQYEAQHGAFPYYRDARGYSCFLALAPYHGNRQIPVTFDFNRPPTDAGNRRALLSLGWSGLICPSDDRALDAGQLQGGETNYAPNLGRGMQAHGLDGGWESLGWRPGNTVPPPLTLADFSDGAERTSLFSEALVGRSLSEKRVIWLDSRRWHAPDELDAWAYACASLPSSNYVQTLSIRGRPWWQAEMGPTFYNHVLNPNGRSCLSAGKLHFGALSATSNHPGGVLVAMASGATAFHRSKIDICVWRALGSRLDGAAFAPPNAE